MRKESKEPASTLQIPAKHKADIVGKLDSLVAEGKAFKENAMVDQDEKKVKADFESIQSGAMIEVASKRSVKKVAQSMVSAKPMGSVPASLDTQEKHVRKKLRALVDAVDVVSANMDCVFVTQATLVKTARKWTLVLRHRKHRMQLAQQQRLHRRCTKRKLTTRATPGKQVV